MNRQRNECYADFKILADEINNYTEPDPHQSEPNDLAAGTSPSIAVPGVQSSGESHESTEINNEIASAEMLDA